MEAIKAYLRFYNNFFATANESQHLLFVEGRTDRDFYYSAFKNDASLSVEFDKICFNFAYDSRKTSPYNIGWIESFGDSYRNQARSVVEEVAGQYQRNYDFVIAATHDNNLPKENCKIECFGIIDRDFGDKLDCNNQPLGFYAPRKLSQSEYHDRESSLIYDFLPSIFKLLSEHQIEFDRDEFIDIVSKTLLFTNGQGILEEMSIKTEPMLRNYRIVGFNFYKFSHENFRQADSWEQQKLRYGDAQNFNFIRYIDNQVSKIRDNSLLINILTKCKKDIQTIALKSLKQDVALWLINNTKTPVLNDIFNKSNGHLLEKNLTDGLNKFLTILYATNMRVRTIIGLIEYQIISNGTIASLFKCASPVKEYASYRSDIKQKAED